MNNSEQQQSATTADGISSLLERRFLYQNQQTGNISATSLTTRQLCRVLCPSTASASISNSTSAAAALTPDTQLLALNDDGSYSNDGWKVAKTVPVIREAVAQWYYEEVQQQQQQQVEPKEATATETSVKGPVNCRTMSAAIRTVEDSRLVQTRVYSDTVTYGTWKTISELPNLQAAIQAFDVVQVATLPADQQQQQYDPSDMVYNSDDDDENKNESKMMAKTDDNDNVHDELELFLASTDHLGGVKGKSNKRSRGDEEEDDDEDEDEAYESDGGTRYMKHQGKWVHEDLVPKKKPTTNNKKTATASNSTATNNNIKQPSGKRKNKKAKFSARNARCWIYVTGLPPDTTEDELSTFFAKAGLLDLNPETQKPKIKLYKQNNGICKGDASICYARPESVELAVTLFDEAPFRDTITTGRSSNGSSKPNDNNNNNGNVLKVEHAKFEQRTDVDDTKLNKPKVSYAKRKVAKLATRQAMDWDDGEFNGRLTGGLKGLRIIVIKHLFHPKDLSGSTTTNNNEDALLASLEQRLMNLCEPFGTIEKMTVFSKHYEGVVIVKFTLPGAASDAVQNLNGHKWVVWPSSNKTNGNNNPTTLEASFWDGVTDYTVRDHDEEHEEENKRLDEFGHWLDQQQKQELPDELKLQTQE